MEDVPTSFMRTSSARCMLMLSSHFACVGGRLTYFGSMRSAGTRSLAWMRMLLLRRGLVAVAFLTPGLDRVMTTELYLCPTLPPTRRKRSCRRYWCRLESTRDWPCVCSFLPSSLPRAVGLGFLREIHYHRPGFKIRVLHILEQGSCRASSPTDSYHHSGAKPTHRTQREPPVRHVP
jgi:hypothetical protein